MNVRQVASLVVAAGSAALFVVGLMGLLGGGDGAEDVAATTAPTTTTAAATSTVATSEGTTTTTANTTTTATTTSTTQPPTTTTEATTTTTEGTTTTTAAPTVLVETFIADLGAALDAGEIDFVFSRLHPALVLGFGEELCRDWVAREIMALSDYTQGGPVMGPTTGSLDTPGGQVVFDERYTVDITFMFSGAEFSTAADYVLLDGVVYFTGTCR